MSDELSPAEIDFIALFKKAVWQADQKRLDNLALTDAIASLGIDSVAMMEVIGHLEDELEVHLSDEALASVKTVRDLTHIIATAKSAG